VVGSPDGKIEATMRIGSPAAGTASCLSYSVTYEGKALLLDSPLEFRLEGADGLLTEMTVVKTDRETVDQTWERVWGKCKTVRDHCNEMRVGLESKSKPKRKLDVIWRAYDDGVAFRYFLPVQSQIKKFKLTDERSQFRFADDHTVWAADYGQFTTHQESEFAEGRLSGLKPGGIYGLPLLVSANDRLTAQMAPGGGYIVYLKPAP
jgi:alpha-glucosidase